MKKYLLLLFLFPFQIYGQEEVYYVTFIKGQVLKQETKEVVKIGEKLNAADKIIFKENNSKLGCISPGKGRFELSAQQVKPNQQGEIVALLKSNILPLTNTYHLSTRSVLFEGYDPKTYFNAPETEGKILLFSDKVLPILGIYKIDPDNFFFIQFIYQGKTYTKKIEGDEKGLFFNENLFKDISGNIIPNKVLICYQSKISGKSSSITLGSFSPVFVDQTTLYQQLDVIKNQANITDKKKFKEEIVNHIFSNYGKIGFEEIQDFLNGVRK